MFELKVDPEYPHHYIIGVGVTDPRSKTPGKMFLKYGPLHFTNKEVENVSNALILLKDKIYTDIYKMSAKQLYELTGCDSIIMSLVGLKIAAQANAVTLHHFSVPNMLHDADKFFEGYIKRAQRYDGDERRGLHDARIRGW